MAAFHNKSISEIAKAIGISQDRAWAMTTDELENYVLDACRNSKYVINEFMGLPDNVDINADDWYEEDIANYLTDTYGFCVNGWEYA